MCYRGWALNTGRGSDIVVLIEAEASIRGNTVTQVHLVNAVKTAEEKTVVVDSL